MTGYCPEHDPILACGFLRCGLCGHAAWPTDAEWLDGGTILASYPASCEHHDAVTLLVTLPRSPRLRTGATPSP